MQTRFVGAEVGQILCPPKRYPEASVHNALFQDEEDHKNEKSKSGEDEHAVQPIRFFQRGDELL